MTIPSQGSQAIRGSQACPAIGVWRAWLDHEEPAADLPDHLARCAGCQALVEDLRDGAQTASMVFDRLAPAHAPSVAEVAAARQRLALRQQREVAATTTLRTRRLTLLARISTPWRIAGGGIAAALALSVVVAFTPEGQATAAAFLAQFRSQQVTAVELTPQSQSEIFRTLNALGNLGTVKTTSATGRTPEAALRSAAEQSKTVTLAEASGSIGFALKTPDPTTLPAGLDRNPRVQVMPGSEARFTFERSKARAYLESTGNQSVSVPDKFDGAALVISIPSAVLLQYGDQSSNSALIIGQAGELVVDVEGKVTLAEMRDVLLSMPGLPPSVVNQMKKIDNWNRTLPIPVPVDQVNWQSASFRGHQGLLLNDNSNVLSAAIWYEDGHMYGLAGSLKATELKRIADSLAVRN